MIAPLTASVNPLFMVSVMFFDVPKVRLAMVVVAPEFKVGWLVNATTPILTASPDAGADPELQFVPVPQSVFVVPFQSTVAAETRFIAANAISPQRAGLKKWAAALFIFVFSMFSN